MAPIDDAMVHIQAVRGFSFSCEHTRAPPMGVIAKEVFWLVGSLGGGGG